jgi:hypothetical protein
MREIVPPTAVLWMTMNEWPPSEHAAPRKKSAGPPVDEMEWLPRDSDAH